MRRPGERGFTLIEVVVALAIGALVVLVAHRTFTVAGALAELVEARRLEHDRAMNARRWLTAAFGSLEIDRAAGRGFEGREGTVSFATWLPREDGTMAVERVTITAVARDGSFALAASLGPDTLMLAPDIDRVACDYLLEFGAAQAWIREWRSPVTAPVAVRLRIARADPAGRVDTLLFAVGRRG